MKEEIIIRVHNLCKEYYLYDRNIDQLKELVSIRKRKYHKVHNALQNINFEVKRGEHIGIIGTNGSGKSTLLKILTGVVTPTSGTVDVRGRISALLELGAGFNPSYTGIENIYFNGTVMGYTREEMTDKLEDIVSFADIGEFINQPVKTYSSGMFARLAFAVAINVEPDILIVDEALSVGDAFFQNKCYRKFEELKQKGVTILLVSHDIESIKQMCSRVLWIEQGIQRMFGGRNEVCQAYFNLRMQKQNEGNMIYTDKIRLENGHSLIKEKRTRRYPLIEAKQGDIVGEDVKVLSCSIRDENQNIVSYLFADHYYEVEILSRANRDIPQIIIGFTLSDIKGIGYLSGNTYAENKEQISIRSGETMRTAIGFRMPSIKRGKYLLDIAVAEGTQEKHIMLAWMHSVYELEISWEGYELSLLRIPYTIENSIEQDFEFM